MQLNQVRTLQLKIYLLETMQSRHSFYGDSHFGNIMEVHNELDDLRFSQNISQLKPCDEPTRLCKLPSVLDFLHSSSLQEGARHYEISFEDNFMEEHEKALKNQMENFMEASFKTGGNEKITFESSEMFNEELQFGSLKNEEENLTNFQNTMSFLSEIQKQEKLQEFFQLVYTTVPKKVASEILYVSSVAYFAWERNLKNNIGFSSELQVVCESKKLAEQEWKRLYNDERISFLNLKKVCEEELNSQFIVQKNFKSLIEFFFSATGLIFLGFFANPYMETEETKRGRSFRLEDDEDELSSSSTDNQMGVPKKRFH